MLRIQRIVQTNKTNTKKYLEEVPARGETVCLSFQMSVGDSTYNESSVSALEDFMRASAEHLHYDDDVVI